MKLVTAAQMQAIEHSSVEAGVSLDTLMENAGLAVAETVRDYFGKPGELYGKRIVILVGPGNNGADGLVAGRHLAAWGAVVRASLCTERRSPDPKRELAEERGVTVVDYTTVQDANSLAQILESTDLVLDAVLGTGTSRPIDTPLASSLFSVLESAVPVVALDLPTGLNSDTGEFDIAGLPADQTIMLGYPKLGAALSGDPSVIGETIVLDVGIPEGLDSQVTTELMTSEEVARIIPERSFDGHKGTFGSTLIVAGSKDYLGAVTMTTDAACRSGVGLTFVATPAPAYQRIAGDVSGAMYTSLPTTVVDQIEPTKSAEKVLKLAERSTAVVIGPGLGTDSNTQEFVSIVLREVDLNQPLVVDADALNILSKTYNWWVRFENPAILTPHPGEMGRLLGISAHDVQNDRLGVALDAAKRFGKIVVLKGAATLIASPDGRVSVSPWVNSGLAKGGSGDVLAGLLGGLIAQEPDSLFDMACLAVFTHGYAAELAQNDYGELGMKASDVIERLGHFSKNAASGEFA